jgi:hypothetical protein
MISNQLLFILIIIFIIILLTTTKEGFTNSDNNLSILKNDLLNCKDKLKYCSKKDDVSFSDINKIDNKSTLEYYLEDCNDELKKLKCFNNN